MLKSIRPHCFPRNFVLLYLFNRMIREPRRLFPYFKWSV